MKSAARAGWFKGGGHSSHYARCAARVPMGSHGDRRRTSTEAAKHFEGVRRKVLTAKPLKCCCCPPCPSHAPVSVREDPEPEESRRAPSRAPPQSYFLRAYLACLKMYFVISNIVTDALPPKSAFSLSSALIWRRFFLSCRLYFLM